jgi:hypothetical protein
MPNTTVRANARTLPDDTKPVPTAPPTAESPADEYLRLQAAKIVADVLFERAAEKMKAEADADAKAKAQEPKRRASRAFAEAYHARLAAKADDENPSVEDEQQAERFSIALPAAERQLMVTPSAYPYELWQKLEAFEAILADEIMSGPRRDSVILLALASIKQDIVNMDLLEAIR